MCMSQQIVEKQNGLTIKTKKSRKVTRIPSQKIQFDSLIPLTPSARHPLTSFHQDTQIEVSLFCQEIHVIHSCINDHAEPEIQNNSKKKYKFKAYFVYSTPFLY